MNRCILKSFLKPFIILFRWNLTTFSHSRIQITGSTWFTSICLHSLIGVASSRFFSSFKSLSAIWGPMLLIWSEYFVTSLIMRSTCLWISDCFAAQSVMSSRCCLPLFVYTAKTFFRKESISSFSELKKGQLTRRGVKLLKSNVKRSRFRLKFTFKSGAVNGTGIPQFVSRCRNSCVKR